MNNDTAYKIRHGRQTDAPYVISTWIKSYRHSRDKRIHDRVFYKRHNAIVDDILGRKTTTVLIACDIYDDDTIIGYLVYERGAMADGEPLDRDVVHYVFVKEPFQHKKIATRLLEAATIDPCHVYISHLTRDKFDTNERSPRFGETRWRGGQTLLAKWPLAYTDWDAKTQVASFVDGNLYDPSLWFLK